MTKSCLLPLVVALTVLCNGCYTTQHVMMKADGHRETDKQGKAVVVGANPAYDLLIPVRIVELGLDFSRNENSTDFFRRAGRRTSPDAERPSVVIPGRNEFLRMTAFGQSFVATCIGTAEKKSEQCASPADCVTVSMASSTTTIR